MDNNEKNLIDKYLTESILKYTTPVIVGSPSETLPANGSISLIQIGDQKYGITCAHVIREYEKRCALDPNTAFQIARQVIKPLDLLIDINDKADIATLNFKDCIFGYSIDNIGIGTSFYQTPSWPPADLEIGDRIGIADFPGENKFEKNGKLWLATCSISAQPITDIDQHRIVIAFDRDTWYYTPGQIEKGVPRGLGGMSGGPAFLFHDLTTKGLLYAEFIGIVEKQMEMMDILCISRASQIEYNGKIIAK